VAPISHPESRARIVHGQRLEARVMASKDAAIFPDRSPKRVVLRLKVSELERRSSSEYDDAIKAYLLLAGRPANEDEVQRRYFHIEPF